ncbi:hypothetical protein B9Z55_005884 [Caenorhabditis nigoni]|uniref:Kinesin motor domain-containing protein n=1 Tax=Caenorhabditis nigoni TaxID=1611254 RepID=A0A2G5V2X5_9PELO|nr:hypothetical protein B9Z55_005884 [Caenorhabditis nigoni]
MNGVKNMQDNFRNPNDLVSQIEQLTKKTAVIPSLEHQLHTMKHREKVFRRQSAIFPSASSLDVSKAKTDNETVSKLTVELERVRSELERTNEINMAQKEEIKRQNRKILDLSTKPQKLVAIFQEEMQKKDELIRKLNDEVVDLRGQIRVAIRVRDFNKDPSFNFQITSQNEVKFQQNNFSNVFAFENVFQPGASQPEVFDDIKELILCALHGKNVSLIAYGPTSSGKTYTMRGESGDEKKGVIPRAIGFLLEQSKRELAVIGWTYNFDASFIEVYNEEVFDLLDDKKKLEMKQTTTVGSKKIPIKDMADVTDLLELADSQRSVATTACNQHSSRSHAIFQINIDGVHKSGETVKCCLNLVDLAGSERAKESGAQGKQFTELTKINQSLSTLKKCIRAQKTKMPHVPWRESKLTILLRDYLGAGSSKTMFIAHVNPSDASETKRTLEFTADLRSTNIGKATVQTGQ